VASENVQLVRRGFEAFEREGVEALLELVAPDFELTTPPELASEPDTYRGPEGLRRYFDSFYDAMDEIHLEPHAFHESGDWVVVEYTLRARGRTSGIEAAIDAVMNWRVADGLARRVEFFATLDEALNAARGDA
jgi:ketosteroid isomerase-like protein